MGASRSRLRSQVQRACRGLGEPCAAASQQAGVGCMVYQWCLGCCTPALHVQAFAWGGPVVSARPHTYPFVRPEMFAGHQSARLLSARSVQQPACSSPAFPPPLAVGPHEPFQQEKAAGRTRWVRGLVGQRTKPALGWLIAETLLRDGVEGLP